jgi:hypothetical protein
MKKLIILSALFSQLIMTSYAQVDTDVSQERMRVKEIKELLETIPTEKTCLDEYLARRKQLARSFVWGPLAGVGATAGGIVVGGYTGLGIYHLAGATAGGYADLAALASGMVIGGFVVAGTYVGLQTASVVQFFKNQYLLKTFAQIYLLENDQLRDLLAEVQEINPSMTMEKLKSQLLEWDQAGRLCDGSLVHPRRFKHGRKLKQRLANKKELLHHLSRL